MLLMAFGASAAEVQFRTPLIGASWNSTTRTFVRYVGISSAFRALPVSLPVELNLGAVTPDGRWGIALTSARELLQVDLETLAVTALGSGGNVKRIIFSPAGTAAMLVRTAEAEVFTRFPFTNERARYSLPGADLSAQVAVTDDGRLVAAIMESGDLFTSSAEGVRLTGRFGGRAIQFSSGSNALAVSDGDAIIVMDDAAAGSGRRILPLRDPIVNPGMLAFARDGRSIIAAESSGLVAVIDRTTGRARSVQSPGPVTTLAPMFGNAVFHLGHTADGGSLIGDFETPQLRISRAGSSTLTSQAVRSRETEQAGAPTASVPLQLILNGTLAGANPTAKPDANIDVWVKATDLVTETIAGTVTATYAIDSTLASAFSGSKLPAASSAWLLPAGDTVGNFTIPAGGTSAPAGLTKAEIAVGAYTFTAPNSDPVTVKIGSSAPVSVKCYVSGNSLDISGATPTLELKDVQLSTSVSGIAGLPQTTTLTSPFSSWFQSNATEPYGAFRFSLTVSVANGSLDLSTISVVVSNQASSASSVACQNTAIPAAGPVIASAQVVNGYSGVAGPVAPREAITIFGTGLANAQVSFDGASVQPTFTANNQVNLSVPGTLSGKSSTVLQLTAGGLASNQVTLQVTPTAPGIFLSIKDGQGNVTTSATAGDTLVILVTGEGVLDSSNSQPTAALSATIGGLAAAIQKSEIITGGILQLTLTVPAGLKAGSADMVVTVGGVSSPARSITITGPTPPTPQLLPDQFQNGYSLTAGPIAPGEVLLVTNDAFRTAQATTLLANFGGQPGATLFAKDNQAQIAVPYGLTLGRTTVQFTVAGVKSSLLTLDVQPTAPGISPDMRVIRNGVPTTVIQNTVRANPGEPLTLFVTGEGELSSDKSAPLAPVSVTIGGVDVTPALKELQNPPAYFLQITVQIPSSVTADSVPIVVKVGDVSSPPATLYLAKPSN
jgi:uncharacterized protein (TIGR03437 family)